MATDDDKKPKPKLGNKTYPRRSTQPPKHGLEVALSNVPYGASVAVDPLRQGVNFLDSASRYVQGQSPAAPGRGSGDRLFGFLPTLVRPGNGPARPGRVIGKRGPGKIMGDPGGSLGEEQPKSLADYLAQAAAMLAGEGGAGVNYDPQRATARSQAAENDARLEAMYRQLRGSIDADAPVIQQAYQEALDSTASTGAAAQAQTQAASDSALARNDAVLANLGIQQAAGNQIQQGTDLASQTAQQIADQASRGQLAGNRLASNQATALAHNTNIGNAAGLEGNLQRAANNAKLQSLLAQIDMEEQQQNASLSQNNFAQKMSLAGQLYGFDRDAQDRQDSIQQRLAELMNERDIAAMEAQGNQLPDLGTYLAAIGQDSSWLREDPQSAARLLDVLRRFGIQQ